MMEKSGDEFVFTKEWLEKAMKLLTIEIIKPKRFCIICHPDDKEFIERVLRGELD
jgi:hypothetical protein